MITKPRRGKISPKKKLAIVAATTVVAMVLVVVGLASLAPKSKPESVNRPPVASFSYVADNLTVTFNASASSDPDGTIANYSWSFGDDAEGTGVEISHTYLENGTYKVKLTVTDNGNAANSTFEWVTVEQSVEPVKPSPTAVVTVVSQDNLTVNVSGASSIAPEGGTIVLYEWSFEGGGTATGVYAVHTFAANGTYNITLTVTADNGMKNTTTVEVTVSISPTPPPPPPPPPLPKGPPGLLHAIEIHEAKAGQSPGISNSLNHLESNLERWLSGHMSSMIMA